MRSLRTRLILSHLLPLLIVVPLAAFGLTYLIETQVLLVDLSESLTEQAQLIARAANSQPGVWQNVETAQVYVRDMTGEVQARIMLLQPSGYVLAASHPVDHDVIGQDLDLPGLSEVQSGKPSVRITYSLLRRDDLADVLVPVVDTEQQVVGIVRATNQLASVSERFWQLRQTVLGMVIAELAVGALVGLALALRLERPLRAATIAVNEIAGGTAAGTTAGRLEEEGPAEIRQLLGAVNRLAQRLAFLEDTRRRLLANVVHELGRPLGALRAAVHALRTGANEDEILREELLAGMDSELRTLQTLLDDMAQLHSQVLDAAVLERRVTPLGEWLQELLPPWREAAQEKGIHWQADIPAELATVEIDRERLGQAVGNLLSNAIKYTPAGQTVGVGAGRAHGTAWVRVADTGPGIAAEEQARIFEPFYRAPQEARFPQGLGLGLTITRDLVSAHGGRLEVESEPGQGSQFTIYLPI